MTGRRFTIILTSEPDAGGFSVRVPALPGCQTQGETRDEAIDNAKDAIEVWIESALAAGDEIPSEDTAPELVIVSI